MSLSSSSVFTSTNQKENYQLAKNLLNNLRPPTRRAATLSHFAHQFAGCNALTNSASGLSFADEKASVVVKYFLDTKDSGDCDITEEIFGFLSKTISDISLINDNLTGPALVDRVHYYFHFLFFGYNAPVEVFKFSQLSLCSALVRQTDAFLKQIPNLFMRPNFEQRLKSAVQQVLLLNKGGFEIYQQGWFSEIKPSLVGEKEMEYLLKAIQISILHDSVNERERDLVDRIIQNFHRVFFAENASPARYSPESLCKAMAQNRSSLVANLSGLNPDGKRVFEKELTSAVQRSLFLMKEGFFVYRCGWLSDIKSSPIPDARSDYLLHAIQEAYLYSSQFEGRALADFIMNNFHHRFFSQNALERPLRFARDSIFLELANNMPFYLENILGETKPAFEEKLSKMLELEGFQRLPEVMLDCLSDWDVLDRGT